MKSVSLGSLVQSYFLDYLRTQKGVLPSTIHTYRDVVRSFLLFVSADSRRKLVSLSPHDLTPDRVRRYLQYLEDVRHNHVRTRNHRLAVLHSFFGYLALRMPDALLLCQQVTYIPMKRTVPPQTDYLERDEIAELFRSLPSCGRKALRDRALLLFLYNTGARVQEVVELRVQNLDLEDQPRVQLHGKGNKWRTCPLWTETARQLKLLVGRQPSSHPDASVFESRPGRALTRFGIYKLVRRLSDQLKRVRNGSRHISPHLLRHTAAVHLLEAGVEVNVIRGWLGHASLQTTNRYAEITTRTKEAALRLCEPLSDTAFKGRPVWQDDTSLLAWLDSL